MTRPLANMAASVRQRLLNLSRERKEDFGLVLTKYGLERVLYRIAQSKYRELFVLKGALLFEFWTAQRYRPTRDADFLARGENRPEKYVEIFTKICNIDVEKDGHWFDAATVTAERINEDAEYEGLRVRFIAYLENARIPIQIDLGFGDAVTPAPIEAQLPTLLELPAPKLLAYPRESVVAEKFEALVHLGIANSRMKDLHDIQTLLRQFSFDGALLAEALANPDKQKQWAAFCEKNRSYAEESTLQDVCKELERFLTPVLEALASNTKFARKWTRKMRWH